MAISGTIIGNTPNELIIPKIIWNAVQSFETNTSTITATLYYSRTNKGDKTDGWWDGSLTIDGDTKTVYDNKITISYNSNTAAITHTVVVPHNADGSKTLEISATGLIPSTSLSATDISATITLDAFERLSEMAVSDGTLGTAQTLTVHRKADIFAHTITYACGTASGSVCVNSYADEIAWTPPISLAEQNTTGLSVSITVKIETILNGQSIGAKSYLIVCKIPDSVKPSIANVAVNDVDGYQQKYGDCVQGYSRLNVVITPKLAYGADIVSCVVEIGESTYTGLNITSYALMTEEAAGIVITVTDARGRTGKSLGIVHVLKYSNPAISLLKVQRCDSAGNENEQGAYIKITFSASVTPLNNKNSAAYMLEYKKSSESEYTSIDVSSYANNYAVSDASVIVAADTGASFDVRLSVTDDFATSTKTAVASTASTLMHWLANGLGMAIGKVAELTNVLDINFQTRFLGGILHPVLAAGTDLNDAKTPNTYIGNDAATSGYLHCPFDADNPFLLEVISAGTSGQVFQRLTQTDKAAHIVYTRFYYNDSGWSDWQKNDGSASSDEINELSESVTEIQHRISDVEKKTYADGFVFVDFGELANNKSVSFELPDGVAHYWLDSAWAEVDTVRYSFPIVTSMGVTLFTANLLNNAIIVFSEYEESGYNGFFVVAYKLAE